MRFVKSFSMLLASSFLSSSLFANSNLELTPPDLVNMVNLLISNKDQVPGLTYQGTVGSLNGLTLPLSYYSTADYWAKYVCTLAGNNCTVEDAMGVEPNNPWSLGPDANAPGGDLQYERVNVNNGTNIYDAATWQIAMALAAKNGIPGATFDLANNINNYLTNGYDGNAPSVAANANRGNVQPFVYYQTPGQNLQAQNSYFFRMVTRTWLSADPFMTNAAYLKQFITINPNTPLPSNYTLGQITWADWKPITGENAWAFLIGPLQAAFLQYGSAGEIPLNSPAVQNALGAVSAFRAMQSPLGAVYYGPANMYGNQGGVINPYEVSTENNASLLAGLTILQQILNAHGQPNSTIQTLIYGDNGATTAGILSYLKNNAWNPATQTFYQGGLANQPGQPAFVPTAEPQAVDVNTWAVTVLGQPLIDSWFGAGTANTIWQKVKSWGGFYGPDNTLWGVGFSDQDGNGGGTFNANGILSVEWTVGAINMVKALMVQYGPAHPAYAALKADYENMLHHLSSLRTDQYANYASAFPQGIAPTFNKLVPLQDNQLGFLYASKRYAIPFGWFANPLPSTCATAWMIMEYYGYNPFVLGGGYVPNYVKK